MAITVTKEGDRTKIRGSETYANGMTLTFYGMNERIHWSKRAREMYEHDSSGEEFEMGRGVHLGRAGKTYTGKNSEGQTVEYSGGLGLRGGQSPQSLSSNYGQHGRNSRRISIGR